MCERNDVKYRLVDSKLGRSIVGGKYRYYVTLTFGGKEEDGYYEIIIPKVMLPFDPTMNLVIIEENNGNVILQADGHYFPIEPVFDNETHFHMIDFKGNDVEFKRKRIVKVKTKDIPEKEMTIEEIEKALGYRVKIVKEK